MAVLTVTMTLTIAEAAKPDAVKADCDTALAKASKKNVGPGTELKLNDQLFEIELTSNLGMAKKPTDLISAYLDLYGPLGTTIKLPPGTRIKALSKVKKRDGITFVEIEIPEANNFRGIMYWIDLYRNAKLVKAADVTETGAELHGNVE